MRKTAYLALLTVLTGSAYPAPARAQGAGSMLTNAVEHEAARLAAQAPSSSSPSAGKKAAPGLSDWSQVVAINPGDEIVLTTPQSSGVKRRLLRSDAASVTILNLDDPGIQADVRDALADAGEDHPANFAEAERGGRFLLTKHVRLGPDGVFEDDRRLFDLSHVVQVVPRDEVVEIGVMGKHVWRHSKRGALIGAGAGAVMGAITALGCDPKGESDYCNVGGMAAFFAIGGAGIGLELGTVVGGIAPRTPDVVYRRVP